MAIFYFVILKVKRNKLYQTWGGQRPIIGALKFLDFRYVVSKPVPQRRLGSKIVELSDPL